MNNLISTKILVVLSVTILAIGLLFGTALANPDIPLLGENGISDTTMHGQMDPETYGQMIQRMISTHGAEATSEMLQNMGGDGDCQGEGHGMMNWSPGIMMTGLVHSVRGMMNGGMMNGGMMNGGSMMGH